MAAPKVRRATLTDATAIAEVHVASFKAAHRGLVPLADVTVERREAGWRDVLARTQADGFVLVAERDDRVAGFCHLATPSRDADRGAGTAELTAIYVDPRQWRSGLGGALMRSAIDELTGRWRELTLWVLAPNHRARSFYAAFDFVADAAEKTHGPSGRREVRLRAPLPGHGPPAAY